MKLIQSDILTLIVECSMEYETDGQKYDLYQFESKSKYFYFVDGYDDYVHETMFSVEKDKHDVKSIISDFENEFYDNICLDGEFSLEELLEKGVSININIYLGK